MLEDWPTGADKNSKSNKKIPIYVTTLSRMRPEYTKGENAISEFLFFGKNSSVYI